MAFDDRSLDDYIDVPQRIADFRQHHPDGRLHPADPASPYHIVRVPNSWCRLCAGRGQLKAGRDWKKCPRCDGKGLRRAEEPQEDVFIVYAAAARRDADDPHPGVGMAWESYPGQTPYTLGSELMNAETSAWGRAIVATLAADAKRGVSSREEVRNRAAEGNGQDWRSQPTVEPRRVESTPDVAQWEKPTEPVTDMDWMREVVDDKIPAAKDQETLNGYWADGLAMRDQGALTPEHWEEIKAFIRERAREIIPANGKPEPTEQPAGVAT